MDGWMDGWMRESRQPTSVSTSPFLKLVAGSMSMQYADVCKSARALRCGMRLAGEVTWTGFQLDLLWDLHAGTHPVARKAKRAAEKNCMMNMIMMAGLARCGNHG